MDSIEEEFITTFVRKKLESGRGDVTQGSPQSWSEGKRYKTVIFRIVKGLNIPFPSHEWIIMKNTSKNKSRNVIFKYIYWIKGNSEHYKHERSCER